MPNAATKPMHRALIAQPTAIVRPPPLTAESTSTFTSQHMRWWLKVDLGNTLLGMKETSNIAMQQILHVET